MAGHAAIAQDTALLIEAEPPALPQAAASACPTPPLTSAHPKPKPNPSVLFIANKPICNPIQGAQARFGRAMLAAGWMRHALHPSFTQLLPFLALHLLTVPGKVTIVPAHSNATPARGLRQQPISPPKCKGEKRNERTA